MTDIFYVIYFLQKLIKTLKLVIDQACYALKIMLKNLTYFSFLYLFDCNKKF